MRSFIWFTARNIVSRAILVIIFNNVSVVSTLFQQCKLFFKTSLIWNNRDENQNSHYIYSNSNFKKIFADKIFSKEIDEIESNSRNLRGRFSRNPYTIYYAWCTIIPRIPRRLYISILRINEKKKEEKLKKKKKKFVERRRVTTRAWPPVKEEKS